MYVCAPHVCSACGAQKTASDPQETELKGSFLWAATCGLWRSSWCSEPLSHNYSPSGRKVLSIWFFFFLLCCLPSTSTCLVFTVTGRDTVLGEKDNEKYPVFVPLIGLHLDTHVIEYVISNRDTSMQNKNRWELGQFLRKLNRLPCDPAVSLLSRYTKELKAGRQQISMHPGLWQ